MLYCIDTEEEGQVINAFVWRREPGHCVPAMSMTARKFLLKIAQNIGFRVTFIRPVVPFPIEM